MEAFGRRCTSALLILLILSGLAQATPYWAPGDRAVRAAHVLGAELADPARCGVRLDPEACREAFARIAAYLDRWQVHALEDPQFGGVREGEHLAEIVQTDNTSQAIWVWSRYAALTGDDTYHPNILDAFLYSQQYPAYLEEGGDSPTLGYYRMYNCGWAVLAEQAYRDAFGCETYRAYADSCARYIRDHALIRFGTGFYAYVNPPVYAWALGNLYAAGARRGNLEWVSVAVTKSDTVRLWVEEEPALLADETWAMSGGATIWGLLNSYFRAHPGEAADWIATHGSALAEGAGEGSYQNGWDGWYALGHWAVAELLDDAEHRAVHANLTSALLREDGDLDGGIPGSRPDSDDMDQSWVTSLLAFGGCDPLLSLPAIIADETPGIRNTRDLLTPALLAGPSPAAARLALEFFLPEPGEISLAVHDAAGRRLAELIRGERSAGRHLLCWDGRDRWGRVVPSGTYWIRLRAERFSASRPIVWVN